MNLFEVKTRDLGGRIGKLVTRHGVLETPFLFPVIDPHRQVPGLPKIRDMGFNGIITNAYLFYKRSRGLIKPIHDELAWTDVIMTDSGGYQILIYGDVEADNKTIVMYEKSIGSDIAVILDVPTGSKMSFEEAQKAVWETYRRGIEALPLIMDADQLWVYPVQGAPYKELVARSTILANKLPYDIYAVGSPTVMLEKYKYSELVKLVVTVRARLPPGKPLHVFGVGHPMIIPFLVAVGGDLFDSASYILYARGERYMTETGTRNIRDLVYFPCNCPVCSKYTPQEVLEMPREGREEVIATHNLHVLIKEIKTVKEAIKEGRLWELLEYRSRAHPALYEAFNVIKKYVKLLEKTDSTTSPSGKALLLFNADSCVNPRLRVNVRKALLRVGVTGKTVILIPAYRKPYTLQEEYKAIAGLTGTRADVEALFIHPLLGVFKPSVSSTYPFYQHECRITRRTANPAKIAKLIDKVVELGARKVVVVQAGWFTEDLFRKTTKYLSEGVSRAPLFICKLNEISSLLLQ